MKVSFILSSWRKKKYSKDANSHESLHGDHPLPHSHNNIATTISPPLDRPTLLREVSFFDHDVPQRSLGKRTSKVTISISETYPDSSSPTPAKISPETTTRYGAHGPPVNAIHGPPHNAVHGPPPKRTTHSAPSLTTYRPQLPPRPARPPNLNLFSTSEDLPTTNLDRTLVPFLLRHPNISSPDNTSSSGLQSRLPYTGHRMRPKRSMPELDGTWRGFLEDVAEDADSLISRERNDNISARRSRNHHRSVSKYHTPIQSTEPAAGSSKSLPSNSASGSSSLHAPSVPRPVSKSREHRINSRSTISLPHYREPINPIPPTPTPSLTAGGKSMFTDISLSMFPAPPPLTLGRRNVPSPLVLRPTPSIASLPPSPLSPAFGTPDSSPEVTPVATPTTPKFPQPHDPYVARKSNSIVSILKSPSSPQNSTRRTPPTTPTYHDVPDLPVTPTAPSRTPPPLRQTRSSSNLAYRTPQQSRAHRITSSDSSSDRTAPSTVQKSTKAHSHLRFEYPSAPDVQKPSVLYQETGRAAPQTLSDRRYQEEWGYAV